MTLDRRAVFADAWDIYRRHPVALLVPGVVVFVAFGVPAQALSELSDGARVEEWLLWAASQSVGAVASLLYFGYCEEVAAQARGRGDVSLVRALVATAGVLFSLLAGAVLTSLLIAVGLLLFVVPGLWLLVRLCLVAQVIAFEGTGPVRGMRRASELVRGRLRFVAPTAILAIVAGAVVTDAAASAGGALAADEAVGAFAGQAISAVLIGPFVGVVLAMVYLRLRAAEGVADTSAHGGGRHVVDAVERTDGLDQAALVVEVGGDEVGEQAALEPATPQAPLDERLA